MVQPLIVPRRRRCIEIRRRTKSESDSTDLAQIQARFHPEIRRCTQQIGEIRRETKSIGRASPESDLHRRHLFGDSNHNSESQHADASAHPESDDRPDGVGAIPVRINNFGENMASHQIANKNGMNPNTSLIEKYGCKGIMSSLEFTPIGLLDP